MQVSAINSLNFKGSNQGPVKLAKGSDYELDDEDFMVQDEFIDDSSEEGLVPYKSKLPAQGVLTQAQLEVYQNAKDKAMQNVHPETALIWIGTLAGCYKLGSKAAGFLNSIALDASKAAAKGSIKAAQGLAGVFDKITKKVPVPTDSVALAVSPFQKVENFFNAINENSFQKGSKINNGVKSFIHVFEKAAAAAQNVGKAEGEMVPVTTKISDRAGEILETKIKNPKGLAEAAAGLAIGWSVSDTGADFAEQKFDAKDLKEAAKEVILMTA